MIVVAIAATLLMVATAATAAHVISKGAAVPDSLQNAVRTVFDGRGCVQADQATALLQDQLSTLDLTGWTIEARPGASGSRCVMGAILASQAQVILLPVEAPTVVDAMHAIEARLMADCMTEDEARAFVDSTMDGLGVTAWSIRTDGPIVFRNGQQEAVESHIASGCTVWGGSGHDDAGTLVINLTP